jgi:hypothetical protein
MSPPWKKSTRHSSSKTTLPDIVCEFYKASKLILLTLCYITDYSFVGGVAYESKKRKYPELHFSAPESFIYRLISMVSFRSRTIKTNTRTKHSQ